jgi:phenylacetate-CoA ligase
MYNYFRAAYYLAGMMGRAYWDRRRLEDYQNRKIREIVRYAYENVPFYHEKFDQLGVKTHDIRTIGDLNKLPVLRRKEIAENDDRMISKDYGTGELRVVSTSGSTGRPLFTHITMKEDEFRKAKHLRANIALGQKPWDRWVVITAPHHFSEVTRLQKLSRIYAATPLSVFDSTSAQVSALQKLKPDVLDGYSSSLFLLAKEWKERGMEKAKPKFIIGGAELLDNSSRQIIEESFKAPLFDQYACVELERLAWQCKEKVGYHIDEDSVVMQFVGEDNEEVSAGERGEIVCTSLFNYAMPFIRYAVGDIGVASEDMDCPCGRTFRLMKLIQGRKDSLILLPDGRVVPPLVFGWIMEFFKYYRYIEHYRIIQKKANLFKIFIKKKGGDIDEREMETELARHMKKMLNVDESELTIDLEFVEEIPLDKSGKFTKVTSEIGGSLLS